MFITAGKNQTIDFIDGIGIGATGLNPITDAEWDEWVREMDRAYSQGQVTRAIWQISPKQQPNVRQRGSLTAVQKKYDIPRQTKIVVISTESALARGAMTGITWLLGGKPPLRAYAVNDVERALTAIEREIGTFDRQKVIAAAAEACSAVGFTLRVPT